MCVWKTLLVLTKSNMNRRTTINPRTKATAKIPKSATEKCEGSIFEKTKRPFLQQLIQNGGLVDGHCACGALHRLPSRNEFALITDPVKNKLPALWFFLTILFFFFSRQGEVVTHMWFIQTMARIHKYCVTITPVLCPTPSWALKRKFPSNPAQSVMACTVMWTGKWNDFK